MKTRWREQRTGTTCTQSLDGGGKDLAGHKPKLEAAVNCKQSTGIVAVTSKWLILSYAANDFKENICIARS